MMYHLGTKPAPHLGKSGFGQIGTRCYTLDPHLGKTMFLGGLGLGIKHWNPIWGNQVWGQNGTQY